MSVCRTCLSNNDLNPLFPDKDRLGPRTRQLFEVTGVEINPEDGLSQQVCNLCINLINSASQLRQQSRQSDKILRKNLPPSKKKQHTRKTQNKNEKLNFKGNFDISIIDFESSDDCEFITDTPLEELDLVESEEERRVCIEDYESEDSSEEDLKGFGEESVKNWKEKEAEFLERERRKIKNKEEYHKLMSLAVAPYDSKGPIQCKLCSKWIRNTQNFKCHAKTHFEPQNTCEECGKKFVNPSHMRYHQQRVHNKVKRLACTQCSYRAVDTMQLRNHERAFHTGERPYICDVCGVTFRMRANIAQHMRKHFGVRSLQCERCPAMFRSRSELTTHQSKVHLHVYNYPCYLCNESYKQLSTAKKHLSNVHGIPRNQQLSIKCVKTRRRSSDTAEQA
ncbi:uncharacterized protein LOC142985118 [Anticarsia gemmatalis]|uniref:uncharacterized protein LOC142985118 n=1 Tax=Anticarsia gemmatalis TaxID=129554 RepID=UPI003F759238